VADQNFAFTENNPGGSPNESQWQITFDVGKSIGGAQSASEKESRTVEINPPPTWGGLISAG